MDIIYVKVVCDIQKTWFACFLKFTPQQRIAKHIHLVAPLCFSRLNLWFGFSDNTIQMLAHREQKYSLSRIIPLFFSVINSLDSHHLVRTEHTMLNSSRKLCNLIKGLTYKSCWQPPNNGMKPCFGVGKREFWFILPYRPKFFEISYIQ